MNEDGYVCFREKCLYYFSRVLNRPLIGPDIIQIAVTHRCNLRCKFCDVIKDSYKPEEELTTQTIKNIIDQFEEIGGKKVFFVGGEPFLRKDFFELVDYANSKGLFSLVSTNGTLINEEMARKIVDTPVGLVMFSVEAADGKTHDSLRGEKVFEKISNAIKLVSKIKKERGLSVNDRPGLGILSVVLNSNLEQLVDIIKLTESLGVPFINFQPLQTNNTIMWEKDTSNPEWVSKERYHVLDKALDDVEEYKKKAKCQVTCDTKNIKEYFRCNVKEPDVRCYQNYYRIVIKPNGKLWTCLRYHGNVYNNRLSDLWYSEDMKKERIKAKQCDSMCLQRCIYLHGADHFRQIVENLVTDVRAADRHRQEKIMILRQAIIFLDKQKCTLINSLQNGNEEGTSKKEISDTLQEIEEMKSLLERELTRLNCYNNCQFCYLMYPEFCKNNFSDKNIFLLSHDKELHDKIIGNTNFDNVMSQLGPKKISIIIITKDNYKDLDKIVELVNSKKGKRIMFIFLDPKEGFKDLFYETIPTINEAAYYIKKAKELAEKYKLEIIQNPIPFDYKKPEDLLDGFNEVKPKFVFNKYGTKKQVSVIVSTMNRENLLKNNLQFLFKQDFPKEKYEIIVAGDDSSDGTEKMIRNLKPTCNLTYIFWPRKTKFVPGKHMNRAGPTRNLGVKFSSGRYLIFIDDDVLVKPDFIITHLNELRKNDVVIGTRVDLEKNVDISNLQTVPIKDFERESYYIIHQNKFHKGSSPYKLLYSCNFSLSKKAFLSVNGFDDEYVCWGLEDEALGYKLFKKGLKFVPCRGAVGYHQYHEEESIDIFNKRKGRIYNHSIFYKKYLDWDIYRLYFLNYRETCDFKFVNSSNCNIECVNCTDIRKSKFTYRDTKAIIDSLETIKRYELDEFFDINIGCEFTNHPGFLKLINKASELKNVKVVTNGRMFYYEDFCKKLPDNVLFEVLSFGHDPQSHDKITRVKGSFNQTIRGINNLIKFGKRFMINLVVNKSNYTNIFDLMNKFDNFVDFSITIVPDSNDFQENLIYFNKVIEVIRNKNLENRTILNVTSFFNCYNKLKYFQDSDTLLEKESEEHDKRCHYCDFINECKGELKSHLLNLSLDYIKNAIGDLNQKKRIQLLRGILNGKKAFTGPIQAEISITNFCNMNCLPCWQYSPLVKNHYSSNFDINKKDLMLPFNLFKSLIDELVEMDVQRIRINGQGEPMFHPRVVDMIKYVKKNSDISCSINTNGALINKGLVRKFCKIGLDKIDLSVWAGSAETYVKIRPNQNEKTFYNIKSWLQYLADIKSSYNNLPYVCIINVIFNKNYQDIENMVKFAIETKANRIFCGPVDTNDDLKKLLLNSKELEILKSNIKRCLTLVENSKLHHNLNEFYKRITHTDALNGRFDFNVYKDYACYYGWVHSRILPTGQVIPCGFTNNMIMGDLKINSFREIWNSKKYFEFRKKCLNGIFDDYFAEGCCQRNCCYYNRNRRIDEGVAIVKDNSMKGLQSNSHQNALQFWLEKIDPILEKKFQFNM